MDDDDDGQAVVEEPDFKRSDGREQALQSERASEGPRPPAPTLYTGAFTHPNQKNVILPIRRAAGHSTAATFVGGQMAEPNPSQSAIANPTARPMDPPCQFGRESSIPARLSPRSGPSARPMSETACLTSPAILAARNA